MAQQETASLCKTLPTDQLELQSSLTNESQTVMLSSLNSKSQIQTQKHQQSTQNNETNFNTNSNYKILSLKELINMERKIRTNKRITIELSGCKYDVVKKVAQECFNWNMITEPLQVEQDWNICWYDTYIPEEVLRKMLPYQVINRFPGSINLGRKNFLGKNLGKIKKIHDSYDFYPKTWLLPNQYEELKQYIIKTNFQKYFIVKPENQCQGKGIFLTKKLEGSIELDEHYVVQEYITNPLLIDNLKFDFRVYVLVKSISPLKIFIYREGLARFATVPYEKPQKKNITDMCMHLTNYAINKLNPNFIFNDKETCDDIGHKRSVSAVLRLLQQQGKDVKFIWDEICKIIVKTLCSTQPYLAHIYKSCQPKEENCDMSFEVFGFDIILDENLKPYLLEVNHTPSFTTDTPLDFQIKKNLILDTLILVNMKWKTRKQYYEQRTLLNPSVKGVTQPKITKEELEIQRQKKNHWEDTHMGGYQKIFPTDDEKLQKEYLQYIKTAQDQFDEFSGAKICRVIKKDKDKDNQKEKEREAQLAQQQKDKDRKAQIIQYKLKNETKPVKLIYSQESQNNLQQNLSKIDAIKITMNQPKNNQVDEKRKNLLFQKNGENFFNLENQNPNYQIIISSNNNNINPVISNIQHEGVEFPFVRSSSTKEIFSQNRVAQSNYYTSNNNYNFQNVNNNNNTPTTIDKSNELTTYFNTQIQQQNIGEASINQNSQNNYGTNYMVNSNNNVNNCNNISNNPNINNNNNNISNNSNNYYNNSSSQNNLSNNQSPQISRRFTHSRQKNQNPEMILLQSQNEQKQNQIKQLIFNNMRFIKQTGSKRVIGTQQQEQQISQSKSQIEENSEMASKQVINTQDAEDRTSCQSSKGISNLKNKQILLNKQSIFREQINNNQPGKGLWQGSPIYASRNIIKQSIPIKSFNFSKHLKMKEE